MSIYVYAADRLSPAMRIVAVFFVLVGAAASAVLITNVHAFEGTPAGFKILNGKITDVDPWVRSLTQAFYHCRPCRFIRVYDGSFYRGFCGRI